MHVSASEWESLITTMTSRPVLCFAVCGLFAILHFLVFVYFEKHGTQDFRYGKCVLRGKKSRRLVALSHYKSLNIFIFIFYLFAVLDVEYILF